MGIKFGFPYAVLSLLFAFDVASAAVLDITKFGAKSNSNMDMSKALMLSWKEACGQKGPTVITIPKGTYLLSQLTLAGPCKGPIELQIQGTVKAPADPSKFNSNAEWIMLDHIDHLTMSGGGTLDGQGSLAWKQNDCAKTGKCSKLPTTLNLNHVTDSMFRDITSLNSKLFHVNVIGCKNVTFERFSIVAPKDSPNSDGIHIGRSTGVTVKDSDIKTGDDCVSIGDGSQQIKIEKVTCGPGHGISVGSLGRYENEEPVVGIFVKNCTLTDTMNGVRVKTWPKNPKAMEASNLHFENIVMNNVGTPVLIDQEYCPYNNCPKSVGSRVKISQVSFKDIRGTSSSKVAVKIICSKTLPCENVQISNIDLVYTGKGGHAVTECANVKPAFSGKQNPHTCARHSTH